MGVPIYVNVPYPWPSPTPPYVPADDPFNTVAAYRRTFEVPPEWSGRPVFVVFEGVSSFFYLWVNGQRVGRSKLVEGDEVVIGKHKLVFRRQEGCVEPAGETIDQFDQTMVISAASPIPAADR